MVALERAGDKRFAERTARTLITNAYTFNNDPGALTKARDVLGAR